MNPLIITVNDLVKIKGQKNDNSHLVVAIKGGVAAVIEMCSSGYADATPKNVLTADIVEIIGHLNNN